MRPLKMAFLSLIGLGLMVPTLGAQQSQTIEIAEWEVPWEQSRPRDPYVAPDGKVWFVGQRSHYVAWLDRETGEFGQFPLEDGTGPHNLVVAEDGTVFYSGASGKPASGGGSITIHGGSFAADAAGRAALTFSMGTMEIYGGSFAGYLEGGGSGITVHGGSIGKNTQGTSVVVTASAQIQLLGGTLAGSVAARQGGHLILSGGTIGIDNFTNSVLGRDSAMIEVRGGVFSGRIGAFETSVIDVFGCPLALDASGVLTGLLEDGTPLSVETAGSIQLFACTLNDAITGLADYVASLDVSLFDGARSRVRVGRRSVISGWIRSAAHKIASSQFRAASALLTNVERRVDGDPAQKDWMLPSAERDSLRTVIASLLVLLGP